MQCRRGEMSDDNRECEKPGIYPTRLSVIRSQTPAFKSLPITKNHFGLIHGDLHHHNFLRKEVELTLLDFGDTNTIVLLRLSIEIIEKRGEPVTRPFCF